MTKFCIEVQPGTPLTLAVSAFGGGTGDRAKLNFETQESLEAYLLDKLKVPNEAINIALEKGIVAALLESSAVEQFWKDIEAQTH